MKVDVVLLGGVFSDIPARYMGPYVLRHVCQKYGYSAQVIDFVSYFTEEELYQAIKLFVDHSTICLGLSSTFWNASATDALTWTNDNGLPPNVKGAVARIKAEYPKLKVILGGAKVYTVVKDTELVDLFFVGESERLLVDWLDSIESSDVTIQYTRDLLTKKTYVVNSLNGRSTFNIQTHDFAWADNDCIQPTEALPLETARGCIFKCKFCSYPGLGKAKMDYLRRIDLIASEIETNYSRWGVTKYNLLDDTFNDSEYKVVEWANALDSLNTSISYTSYLRADLLWSYPDTAEDLIDSGLVSCFFGVETLDPKASVVIGKGWSGKHARSFIPELVNKTWGGGVNATLGLIVGLPHETKLSLIATSEWLKHHNLQSQFYGLNISSASDRVYRSVFETQAADYGITFDEKGLWQHATWNHRSAHRFAAVLNQDHDRYRLINNWGHTSALALGFAHQQLMTSPISALVPAIRAASQSMVSHYKHQLYALGGVTHAKAST